MTWEGQRADWAHEVETPAFVLDTRAVDRALDAYERVRCDMGARVLYALKPLVHLDALARMRARLDGFAASSLNEARVAREVLGTAGGKTLSITTPCYRPQEMERLAELCDHVVLNSVGQYVRFATGLRDRGVSVGLRLNPGLPLVSDMRYDPCRPGSKLGVVLTEVGAAHERGDLDGLEGLHFHTSSDGLTYDGLLATVRSVRGGLDGLLRSGTVRWVNLGGGYHLPTDENRAALYDAVVVLRERYGAEVYLEPGAALVREAGYLVASVVDMFTSGGEMVAVLDTTVNHAPEVFEYQYRPDVLGHDSDHGHAVTMAGATCLSGDLFGEYRFAAPPAIGDCIVFPQMGAYTLAKAHWFNGVALPNLYTIGEDGRPRLRRRHTYEDYRARLDLKDYPNDADG
jgi:carboxynorspermidine decarboxylase